jgi:hypothetical protein
MIFCLVLAPSSFLLWMCETSDEGLGERFTNSVSNHNVQEVGTLWLLGRRIWKPECQLKDSKISIGYQKIHPLSITQIQANSSSTSSSLLHLQKEQLNLNKPLIQNVLSSTRHYDTLRPRTNSILELLLRSCPGSLWGTPSLFGLGPWYRGHRVPWRVLLSMPDQISAAFLACNDSRPSNS